MPQPTKRAWATIDPGALRKNLGQVRALCPESKIIPAIKSNAYGHGLVAIARALAESPSNASALAVATLDEALGLSELDLKLPILLLNGFVNGEELSLCLEHGIEPVVHSPYQVALLEKQFSKEIFGDKRKLWLKLNTGMNRLGMTPKDVEQAYLNLHKYPDNE
ncbi:MAG: alanine racemase, partial [Pseudohongiellaceae bacterium]